MCRTGHDRVCRDSNAAARATGLIPGPLVLLDDPYGLVALVDSMYGVTSRLWDRAAPTREGATRSAIARLGIECALDEPIVAVTAAINALCVTL